jgi:hypothetical protein
VARAGPLTPLDRGRPHGCENGALHRAGGNRRVRYRGAVRNQRWLSLRVPVINLRRVVSLGLRRNHTGWALA